MRLCVKRPDRVVATLAKNLGPKAVTLGALVSSWVALGFSLESHLGPSKYNKDHHEDAE